MAETTNHAAPDITPIRRLIRKTVRLLRSSWVATGMGLTLGLGLGTLVAATLLDLAMPLGETLRLTALVLVVVPAAWVFVTGVARPLARRLRPVQVARRIEGHIPGIHNRLVSCIDLDSGAAKGRHSPEFYRKLVEEALDRIRGFRPVKVIDLRGLRRAVGFAAASALAFALAFGLLSDRMPTALARIFSPFADIPPDSGVVYAVEPGDATLLRGDDVTFTARVEKGEPDRLVLEILPDGGAALKYDLTKVGPDLWRFPLTGFETSFDYRVRGGGTWSRRKRIAMVDRPTIEGLSTVVHLPEYLGLPGPRVGPPQVADVTGPEGGAVEVVVRAGGDVAEGEIQLLATRSKPVAVLDRTERAWFQERLPDGANREGRWEWDFRILARPAHSEPAAAGVHGHRFVNAKVPFEVRSGENLFALVYIRPDQKPDAIMLSWHDGKDGEHRAFWGDDKFTDGKTGTPSRRRIGPLPEAGTWVRLEVPASAVDLEGEAIKGMGFSLSGGQCYWHRAGAVPPDHVDRPELYVAAEFPLKPSADKTWTGRFPIARDASYRVELRNELGHPSRPMKAAKVVAIPDNPPQVVLERPGSDLVLSTPVNVPLSIAAYDDFGLADLVITVQRGDSGGFVGRPVKHFDRPKKSENTLTSLDIPGMDLKPGEHIRYRVEARDRKGQSAQTQEFVVRIAHGVDNNSADKQLETYDKNQDPSRENLVKLIAEQAKVQAKVRAVAEKYAPLEEKVKAAQAATRPAPEGAAKPGELPKLDPELAKPLEELRKELAQAAAQEDENVKLGEQVAAGLKQAVEQGANVKMLPAAMLGQLRGVQQAFQDRALQPLQGLAAEMKQGADPKQPPPPLDDLRREADRVQKELEAVKEQLNAASKARKELPQDAGAAVAALREEMLRENAGLTARDLADLQDFLKAREEELKRLEGEQAELAGATPQAPKVILPDIEKRQGMLDPQVEKALADAMALRDAEKRRPLNKDDPDFPANPFQPEDAEERIPPKEEGPDEPAAVAAKEDATKDEGDPARDLDARRKALHDRQQRHLADLEAARKTIAGDEHTLDAMLRELREALGNEDPAAVQPLLDRLMNAPAMRQALAMALRSRQVSGGRLQVQRPPGTPVPGVTTPNPDQRPTTDQVGSDVSADLADLDLATRTVILKMQPRMREELLQGLREEGPEGYRGFIRDYFRRLTRVKGGP